MIYFEVSLTAIKFVIVTCAMCIKIIMIINEKYQSAEVFFRILSPLYFLLIIFLHHLFLFSNIEWQWACIVWVCVRTLLFQQTGIQSWGSRSLDIEIEMTSLNGNFSASISVLIGKNYDDWCAQMKVIFRFQDVTELVQEGVQEPEKNPTEAQKVARRDLMKRDVKTLFIIHQCVV